ncbi:MAG TPA: FAD-dependent oxidoreductase [Actinomycetota bacterium]|nr:FAD-dependent oxidoreductase [Actinomycetota bacterium]
MPPRLVIVGANLTGATAAATLREEGFDGEVMLIGAEAHPPYERPPLSKEYLRGEQPFDAGLVRPPDWYAEQGIEARFGVRVERIDAHERAAFLEGGERVAYEGLLLATGGRARKLRGPPSERVLSLRTLEDADRIRSHLAPGRRLVVVGAGFIGAEVAASARTVGAEVTVLEMQATPLVRAIGPEMGQLYADIHRERGVDLRTGEGVEGVEETSAGVLVRTTAGSNIEGEAVVAGIGIEPNVDLAVSAGIAVDNGIVVDERCRTSAEGVYAAGDVANHFHPLFGHRMRVEHYDNALKQGVAAARSMLGRGEPFDDPHWFWSDQYEYNLQYAGFAATWDRIVVRGSMEERDFVAFYLKDGRVLAALGLNRGREVRRAMRLIGSRAAPERRLLEDEGVDLRTLASSET